MKIKPTYCPPGPRSVGLLPTRTTPRHSTINFCNYIVIDVMTMTANKVYQCPWQSELVNRQLGRSFGAGFPWSHCMSGLWGWPSLPHNFKCNKSVKIVISTIFAIAGNFQSQYRTILINMSNSEKAQNLEIQDCILTKSDQWWPFLKRPKSRCSRGKQSAKAPYIPSKQCMFTNICSFVT